MPPTGKLEFPNGTPRLYTFVVVIVACCFAALSLIWYLTPRYWSVPVADKTHPESIQLDGKILHISVISHWLFTGSFVTVLIAVLALVGLGLYYRWIGVAMPPISRDGTTRLNIDGKR
jgi:hypothetical protein